MANANQQLTITAALDESNIDTSIFVKIKEYLMIIMAYALSVWVLLRQNSNIEKRKKRLRLTTKGKALKRTKLLSVRD